MDATMNAVDARPLQGVPTPRQIPDELDRLTAGVDRLEGLLSELRDRLAPVLRESVPAPAPPQPGDAMENPATTVAGRVRDEYNRIAQLTQSMGSVLSRCDL